MLHSFKTDGGVRLLWKPTSMLHKIPLSNVIGHNLLTNSRRRSHLKYHISDYYMQRRMMFGFEIKVTAAEIEKPRHRKNFISSKGRAVLNGASGSRARNYFRKELGFSEESIEYFREKFSSLIDPNSLDTSKGGANTCWIDAKNYHNFFHFITESLHLALSSDLRMHDIENIIFISKSKKLGDFIEKWIGELRHIIGHSFNIEAKLASATDRPEKIIIPLSCEHLLYQFSGLHHNLIEAARPAGGGWAKFDATPHHVKILQYNSYDETLRIFRERMVRLSHEVIVQNWSKLVYAVRSKERARNRIMKGEDELISRLKKIGFEVVCFENMSPLEQVKCVSSADCLVMQHGAGMTNMIFADPRAHVLELGTYQTAMARWSDFIQISNVSGCHYHQIFLDMDYDNERTDPVFSKDGLIAPVISQDSIINIIDIIEAAILDRRLGTLAGALEHCRYFVDRGAYKQAYRVLDGNAPFLDQTADYWLQRHRVADVCGHVERANEALQKAHCLTRTSTST